MKTKPDTAGRNRWAFTYAATRNAMARDMWLKSARDERARGNHEAASNCFALARSHQHASRLLRAAAAEVK